MAVLASNDASMVGNEPAVDRSEATASTIKTARASATTTARAVLIAGCSRSHRNGCSS